MVSRSTLFGLAVSVAILSLAAAIAFRVLPDGHNEPAPQLLLADIDRYSVFVFQQENGAPGIVFHQVARGWEISSSVPANDASSRLAGNAEDIQRVLNRISTTRIIESVTEDLLRRRDSANRLLPYAQLKLSGSYDNSLTLLFATNVVPDGRLYVATQGGRMGHGYKVIDNGLLSVFPTRLVDFRDRHVLPYPLESLRGFEVRVGAADPILFVKTPDRGWSLRRRDIEFAADSSSIEKLLRYLFKEEFNIEEEAPDDARIQAVGCTREEASVVLRFQVESDSSPVHYELRFGKSIGESGRFYAYVVENRLLVSIDQGVLSNFRTSNGPWEWDLYRNPRIFPDADQKTPIALRIQNGADARMLFRRENAKYPWRLALPASLNVDKKAFREFLGNLLDVTDKGLYEPPAPDPASADLPHGSATTPTNAPVATLEIVFLASTSRVDIAFAPTDDSATNAPLRMLWSVDGGPARIIEDTADLSRLWNMEELTELLLPEPGVPASVRIEAVAPPSVKPYGLLSPGETIPLPTEDTGVSSRALLVGDNAPDGKCYAMVRGSYTVYAISPNDLDMLRQKAQPEPEEPHE